MMTLNSQINTLLCIAFSAIFLSMSTGCSDDSDSTYGVSNSHLAGNYTGSTVMNGYDVSSQVNIDNQGNFLSLSFNDSYYNQPSNVYTVTKGNLDGSTLREFDLIDPGINFYKATGRSAANSDQIILSFSDIPTTLNRPSSLAVYRMQSSPFYLNSFIGSYSTSTLDLFDRLASTINISASTNSNKLRLRYVDDNGCLLDGTVTQQNYQTHLFDVRGEFTGSSSTCAYSGQTFIGLLTYDGLSQYPIMFGTTQNNSNAIVVF